MSRPRFLALLDKRSLFYKVVVPQLVMALSLAGAFGYVMLEMRSETRTLNEIFSKVRAASQLASRLKKLVSDKKQYLISYRLERNPAYPTYVRAANVEIRKLIEEFEKLNTSEMGRELFRSYLTTRIGIEALQEELIRSIDSGPESEVARLFNVWALQKQINEAAIVNLDIFNMKKLREAGQQIQQTNHQFKRILAGLIGLMFLLVVVSAVVLYKYFVLPLLRISQVADQISTGYLGARVPHSKNSHEVARLGEAINRMADSLVDAQLKLSANVKDLSRSNIDLERFAYVACHDLKEPLRTISTHLQLVQRQFGRELSREGVEMVEFAVSGAKRMSTLIDSLLDYSRVGHTSANLSIVNCNDVVDLVVKSIELTIEETGAVVEHSDLPTVYADPGELFQLFQNLIGNALKFRGEKPARIEISAAFQDRGYVFKVKDNGIGFESKHAARIFEIFQRLHSRVTYPGTGIGDLGRIVARGRLDVLFQRTP